MSAHGGRAAIGLTDADIQRRVPIKLRFEARIQTFEIAELCAGAAIPGELLKEISGNAQELRCSPVDMEVDAILVLQVVVDEVVRQASDGRKFMSGFGIEMPTSTCRGH